MQNININNVRALSMKLRNDEYFDFMLYKGDAVGGDLSDYDTCLAADIDVASVGPDNKLYSHSIWEEAINKGVELNDIGFTGVDNGFIHYEKDRISNKEFLNLFTGSTYTITEDDKRLFLSPITGNTQQYVYDMSIEDDYFVLKGGFFQGFYKLEGFDYQTLPNKVDNDWCLSFRLRRRDYETSSLSLNSTHEGTNGIFFYMGARAENKFLKYYGIDAEKQKKYTDKYNEDGYFDDDSKAHVVNCDYLDSTGDTPTITTIEESSESEINEAKDTVSRFNMYEFDEHSNCDCGNSKKKKEEKEKKEEYACDESRAIDDEYWEKDVKITSDDFITSDGIGADEKGYHEIKTDNKFVFFNRTDTGFTVNNWDENISVVLTDKKRPNINLFPLMNRTETGYTVNTIDELYKNYTENFDPVSDDKGNSFALKINEDGSIGYRLGVLDCEAEEHYSMIEEYSDSGVIPMDAWVTITVRVENTTPTEKCNNKMGKLKLYFYVDGRLVFISKEIEPFNFKALNEAYQKQEGVPFNISLGGGTQGLAEVIYPDYYEDLGLMLPLERDFAGTFIGDIKWFKFHTCPLNFTVIKKIARL